MEVDLIFKIAGIGILVSVLAQVLGAPGERTSPRSLRSPGW